MKVVESNQCPGKKGIKPVQIHVQPAFPQDSSLILSAFLYVPLPSYHCFYKNSGSSWKCQSYWAEKTDVRVQGFLPE